MSYKITRRVWALRNIPTTHKVVLLALADFARDNAECFPHISTIMEHTGQSRPTVFRALAWLEENGHILRKNRSAEGKGSIYTILAPALAQERAQVETPPYQTDTPPVSNRDPHAQSPIVENLTNSLTVPAPDKLEREARATRAPARKPAVPPCPDDVPAELYAEWLDYRRAAGAKPLWSARAEALMRGGAKRAGISLAKAMEYTMARTWKGFYPETYLRDEKPQQNGAQQNVRQFKTAREIDEENAAEWYRGGLKRNAGAFIVEPAIIREQSNLGESNGTSQLQLAG